MEGFPNSAPARYWHRIADSRVQCDLCPRFCKLREGQRGLCFVRANIHAQMALTSYGRSSGFCIDPIEKKPLNHFLPGTATLSFGTAGCNLTCKFCQNWSISKSRKRETLSIQAKPETVAEITESAGCNSVAFTYNDPIVFHEYAIDVAEACKERGIKTVAVTSGYVCPEPRAEFYRFMDAANIDLKAFTERFYYTFTGGHLEPVLETLKYISKETSVWFELTTLLIPGENDSDRELNEMSAWVVEYLGSSVPVHFTAFHPDWKMRNHPSTSYKVLRKAREIALTNGVRYAYVGNVLDERGQHTYCHRCGVRLIGRAGYTISEWNLDQDGLCLSCGTPCVGVFESRPGTWTGRRKNIRINDIT